MKKLYLFCLLLGAMVGTAFAAANASAPPDPWIVFINRCFNALELILSRANTVLPSLALLASTVMIFYGRIILRHQKEAKIERADISAKVDGLTSQAIQTAGDAGFAQGAASTTSPAAAVAKLTLAEQVARDVVATAETQARSVVSDAADTAKGVLSDAAKKE
jgi:hypothetical protein